MSRDLSAVFERRRFSIKPGLDRVRALLERLGSPERQFTTVHLVGTNGKGSTAAMLASIASRAGYRTGLFTSPHLVTYRERFRINGVEIEQERLEQLTRHVLSLASEETTFFEVTTALACRYFADEAVDLVVMEAGMGGADDATAAAEGPLTLVTPISLDHCQWLGSDRAAIAATKVSIARRGSIVLSAPQEPDVEAVITQVCRKNRIRHRRIEPKLVDGQLVFDGSEGDQFPLTVPLPGNHQRINASLAVAGAQMLGSCGLPINDRAICDGLASTRWPGRLQPAHYRGLSLLLDGAHNPAGIRALAAWLRTDEAPRRLVLICGAMEDKDTTLLAEELAPLVEQVSTVSIGMDRSCSAEALAEPFRTRGCAVHVQETISTALDRLADEPAADRTILITGSLYLVGEALALVEGTTSHAVRG